jgi:6,7-dimethyl-8-ribityllumazine synthase
MASENLSAVPKNFIDGSSFKVAIIVAQWNEEITSRLHNGCVIALQEAKVSSENIFTEFVPGSFELPLAAKWMIQKHRPDAVICIGCVIKGETYHFELVAEATSTGIMRLNLDHDLPIINCVLADFNAQQSYDRSGGSKGNKGVEAAYTALSMIELGRKLR